MSAAKELSEVVKFVCAVANAVAEAAADGSVTLGDAAHLVPLLYKLPAAVDGLDTISLSDLSLDDMAAINQEVKDTLDLPNDKVELAVEMGLDIAMQLLKLSAVLKG